MSGNKENNSRGISLGIMLKGIGFSYMLTIPLFAVFSLILSRMEFSESYIDSAVLITSVISIFIAGMLSSFSKRSRGWLNGLFAGLVYMLILYIISSMVFGNFSINRYVVTMILIGGISGAIGGIVGVNMKRPSAGRT